MYETCASCGRQCPMLLNQRWDYARGRGFNRLWYQYNCRRCGHEGQRDVEDVTSPLLCDT